MSIPRRAVARTALVATATLTALSALGAVASPLAGATGVFVSDDLRGADAVTLARQTLSAVTRSDHAATVVLRQRLASVVAPQAGVDALQLDTVWSRTDPRRMTAVLSALTQLGVPYHRLGNTPGEAFDCSGLTSWAWGQAGVGLPHQSGRQIRGAVAIGLADVQPGDLLYYPGHVMLALGVGAAMVHAPNSGNVVEVKMLSESQQRRLRVGNPIG